MSTTKYWTDLYWWLDDEPNSRWEQVDRDQVDADEMPTDEQALQWLETWLFNINPAPGSYRLVVKDDDGLAVATTETVYAVAGEADAAEREDQT